LSKNRKVPKILRDEFEQSCRRLVGIRSVASILRFTRKAGQSID
jgi:hypothetical protein